MKKERWEEVKAAFDEASECKGSVRQEFLAALKARDAEVYEEVLSLLKAARDGSHFLDEPAQMD